MSVKFLKVKLKSLAAEARIIRVEEKRARNNQLREQLYLHRIRAVRSEARATHLAYAFLRGRSAHECERNPADLAGCSGTTCLGRVQAMVKKYGGDEKKVQDWLKTEQARISSAA